MNEKLTVTTIEFVRRHIPKGNSGGTGYCEYDEVTVYYADNSEQNIWVPAYYNTLNDAWEHLYKEMISCANPKEAYEALRQAIGKDVWAASFELLADDLKMPKAKSEEKGRKHYRIRKPTPRECFRLMGVSDTDIDKIKAAGISESQQYKMAGNSIVVQCMEGIFRNLFRTDEYHHDTLF